MKSWKLIYCCKRYRCFLWEEVDGERRHIGSHSTLNYSDTILKEHSVNASLQSPKNGSFSLQCCGEVGIPELNLTLMKGRSLPYLQFCNVKPLGIWLKIIRACVNFLASVRRIWA